MEKYKIVPHSWRGTSAYYIARKVESSTSYGKRFVRYETEARVDTKGESIYYGGVDFLPTELHSIEKIQDE